MKTAGMKYAPELQELLGQATGKEWMPLAGSVDVPGEVKAKIHRLGIKGLFPKARYPEAALSGLWLYFSQLDESHRISQDLETPEGSYWHGIMHRREPDAGNAGYWFRQMGRHAVFPALLEAAQEVIAKHPGVSYPVGKQWDPYLLIEFCEKARQRPGSNEEKLAMELQRVEWQILFDYCVEPGL